MSEFVDLLRQPLATGSHEDWDGEQCIMERVSLLWAVATGQDPKLVFSDLPACTNVVIANTAQVVNDRVSDEDRQRLNAFLPRLLRCRRTETDRRINVRLGIWSARYVLPLLRDQDRAVCECAIAAAEAWLSDPSEETAANAAYAAAETLVAFLDELLDAWEEAVTKEGHDLYIPREWEDAALAFVAEMEDAPDD